MREKVIQLTPKRLEQDEEVPEPVQPLVIEPASAWASRPEPAPRDWVMDELIPGGRVTSFLGNGGQGKTTIAIQIAAHVAMNKALFGRAVSGGPVIGIFCEDEQEELVRRVRAACAAEQLDLSNLDQLYLLSRDGQDNLLCTFDREQIVLTPFYSRLDLTIADIKPRLVIIDTAADVFAGDFMSTPHVRQFIKVALGGLCVRHGCAVLLLAHPSASAMNSGDGGGFSTAWNNSVRSRLFLRRPQCEDKDAAKDRRVLELKKANYAPDGVSIPLIYDRGCFVPDDAPVEEGAKSVRGIAKANTRIAMAAMDVMREKGAGGVVVPFRTLLESLQKDGFVMAGDYEAVRKPLQRALRDLEAENLIIKTGVPRGCYRLAPIAEAG